MAVKLPEKLEKMREENGGELPAFTFPGLYPIYYITKDGRALCPDCANKQVAGDDDIWNEVDPVIDADVNYEDDSLYCDECSERIEPAYTDD